MIEFHLDPPLYHGRRTATWTWLRAASAPSAHTWRSRSRSGQPLDRWRFSWQWENLMIYGWYGLYVDYMVYLCFLWFIYGLYMVYMVYMVYIYIYIHLWLVWFIYGLYGLSMDYMFYLWIMWFIYGFIDDFSTGKNCKRRLFRLSVFLFWFWQDGQKDPILKFGQMQIQWYDWDMSLNWFARCKFMRNIVPLRIV